VQKVQQPFSLLRTAGGWAFIPMDTCKKYPSWAEHHKLFAKQSPDLAGPGAPITPSFSQILIKEAYGVCQWRVGPLNS
ncbi:MAG: hypothetical protein KAR21_25360, partial [Spirochaetales bacterium]|nr:hypothetical protein [Spirochaetales bacterium]